MLLVVVVPSAAYNELLEGSPIILVVPGRGTPGLISLFFHVVEVL